ncbi:MAG: serine hydrolase [Cytophagales bacterium]|nr:serine hydrolase [Cytophagales bacterium]
MGPLQQQYPGKRFTNAAINVSSLIGDDGIVCTPRDAVSFLRGLFEGRLLNESTLREMQIWVRNEDGELTYGLGLDYEIIEGEIAYGHGGGGLGAGCQLFYFPEKELFVFFGANLGTVTDSPIHDKAEPILDEMYGVLLR